MKMYLLKRISLMVLTFFVIFFLLFVLIRLQVKPEVVYGPDKELEAARLDALGYNEDVFTQFFIYVKNCLGGDLGVSLKIDYMAPVSDLMAEKLVPSLLINLYSVLISIPCGFALGIYSATHKNKWQDILAGLGIMLLISVPSLVLGFLLQFFMGYKGGLPIVVSSLYEAGGFFTAEMLRSQILPVLTLCLPSIAFLARNVRAEMAEELGSPQIVFAKSLGVSRRKLVYGYALKSAMVPLLPQLVSMMISIFSGSFIVEQIFSVPGIGKLMIQSINKLDYDVFIACSMFYAFISLLSGIVTDVTYHLIDPRIRMGGKKYE